MGAPWFDAQPSLGLGFFRQLAPTPSAATHTATKTQERTMTDARVAGAVPASPAKPPMSPGLVGVIWLVTLLALLLFAQTEVRGIEWGYDYPLMSKHDPTRSLFDLGEQQRRLVQSGRLPSWATVHGECSACTAAKLEQRWGELFAEHQAYVGAGYKHFATRRWLKEAEAARDISLAAWGNAAQLAAVRESNGSELPGYLDDRRAQLLRGDTAEEQRRTELEGQSTLRRLHVQLGFILFALLAGLAYLLGLRYPRRPQRSRLPALSVGHGLLIFIWAAAFVEVVHGWLAGPYGVGTEFPLLSELLPALSVCTLLVGTRESRASTPIRDFLRCPPDRRSRLWMAGAALASVGAIYAFDWLEWRALHWLELVSWTESLRNSNLERPLLDAFGTVVLAPFAEELLFRGVLFGSLAPRLGVRPAALVSCLVFAAVHGRGIYGFASIAVSGYLWARLAARTGSLVPGMFGHALFNGIIVALRALAGA